MVDCHKCGEDADDGYAHGHWVNLDFPDVGGVVLAYVCRDCFRALEHWILIDGEVEGGLTVGERKLREFFAEKSDGGGE